MKAMILAAGKGTRIREITEGEIPKPMVEIDGNPLIEHTVNELIGSDLDEIAINLHFKGEKITEYFGEEWQGTPIKYSQEEQLLGTAGGVKKLENWFQDTFLVVYGDIFTDIDYSRLVDFHRSHDGVCTIMTYKEDRENLEEASIILTDEENRVEEFIEKPSTETIEKHSDEDKWTNAGIYVLEPEIFEFIPDGFSDFSEDVFPKIIESEEDIYIFPQPKDTYWHEMGNPERYRKAVEDVEKNKVNFNV